MKLVGKSKTFPSNSQIHAAILFSRCHQATSDFLPRRCHQEETKKYINTESASSSVKSYQRTIEVDKEDCADDDVQEFIDKLVDRPPVGSAAQTSFVRFRLKDKAGEAGKYKAIKVPCTVSPSSTGGDGGDYVHNVIKAAYIEGWNDCLDAIAIKSGRKLDQFYECYGARKAEKKAE